MATPSIRVGICDDDPLVLDALASYVAAANDLELVGLYRTGAAVLGALGEGSAMDVLLLDIRMPTMSGPEVAAAMSRRECKTRIVYLTSYSAEFPLEDVLSGRVLGALTKDISPGDLAQAIRTAHAGITLLGAAFIGSTSTPLRDRVEALARTKRESAVLTLISTGASNSQIALSLNISESTVKQSLQALTRRAGVSNRTELLMDLHGIPATRSSQGS